MAKQILNMKSMGEVDSGALEIAMNNAIKLLNQDLLDRPSLDKARKLVLQLEMKPMIDTNSSSPQLESVDFAWTVNTRTPPIGSSATSMKPTQDGQLYFHSELPDAPDDSTIMDEAERRRLDLARRERGDQPKE